MPKYITNWNVGHDGTIHAPETEIELTDDAVIDELLDRGAIRPVDAAKPGKSPGKANAKPSPEKPASEPTGGQDTDTGDADAGN